MFLGGIVFLIDYPNFGLTRQEAIEEFEKVEMKVLFGPKNGALSELSLMRTNYKNVIHPSFGNSVYFHEGFITQEAPGTYVFDWSFTYTGIPIGGNAGEIDVVSHEEHLNRVNNGTWRTW